MNIKRKTIRRYTITGKMDKRQPAFDFCARNKLHIIRSGPMAVGYAQYDMDRFKIVAEKVILNG